MAEPVVGDIVAKQRYPWNALVDVSCTVSGMGSNYGGKFALWAVMPDSGEERSLSHFWVVRDGMKSSDLAVGAEAGYAVVADRKRSAAFAAPGFPIGEVFDRAGRGDDFEDRPRRKGFGDRFVEIRTAVRFVRFDRFRDVIRIEGGRTHRAEDLSGLVIIYEDGAAASAEQLVCARARLGRDGELGFRMEKIPFARVAR